MKSGEPLELTNGKGASYTARIAQEDKRHCTVIIEKENIVPAPQRQISIAISLLKNTSRFEWFLEKATEIGVTEIIPLICDRTEHTRFRSERMQQIVVAAMLQSQQCWLPVLKEPTKLAAVMQQSAHTQKLIAHCEENKKTTLTEIPVNNHTLLLIGPEGDFTSQEISRALEAGYIPVSLGNTRLRTETAGIVGATLLANR